MKQVRGYIRKMDESVEIDGVILNDFIYNVVYEYIYSETVNALNNLEEVFNEDMKKLVDFLNQPK